MKVMSFQSQKRISKEGGKPMDLGLNLKVRCHINKNGDGDRFVGVKADTDNAMVFFPMGYRLPENEEDIRNDILKLIDIISTFNDSKDRVLAMDQFEAPQSVNFPVNAYMNIIRYFLEQGDYYKEKEQIRKTADKGKIDFPASLKRNVKFFQEDGSPFFDKYTVRGSKPNEKNLITQIHKYCVFEAFSTLGWLFTPHLPSDPHITLESERFLYTIKQKLKDTYNDRDKLLFQAMVQMLEYLDNENQDKQYYFGTDRFEYVWEKLIDEIFGVRGKEEFFPRTKWKMKFKGEKDNHALEPDSIMLCNNKIYVLDAKYYRYGVTGKMNHLPESSSINKQITYGEYIENCKSLKDKYGGLPIYNAFLMPFNKSDNPFNVTDSYFINVGEATSEWKHNDKTYEKVQGIVVDIRFIMNNYNGSHKSKIIKLANVIDEELEKTNGELPVSS
jgi:hypothetical protein